MKQTKVNFKLNKGAWHNLVNKLGDEVLEDTQSSVKAYAKQYAPVDTGELRSSINIKNNKVIAEADYSALVELGTKDQSAQPYMRPAFDKVKNDTSKKRSKTR